MNQETIDPPASVSRQANNRWKWLFAELLIIVLGVLIALAIDEWREDSGNAELEHQYLQQLVADLRSTESIMSEVADANAISVSAANGLLAALESVETPPLNEVRKFLKEMHGFNNPVPVLGTAEALVTTGDLRMINNDSARSEITRYLSRSRDFFLTPIYQSEELHQELVLRLNIIALRNGISMESRGGPAHSKIAPNVEAFFADTEAYAITAQLAALKQLMLMYREELAADSAELRESLEQLVLKE